MGTPEQMTDNRYKRLPPYMTCPQCGKAGKYTMYYDTLTGEPIARECGKCFVDGCYHLTPSMYFAEHPEVKKLPPKGWTPPPPLPVAYVPMEYVTDYIPKNPYWECEGNLIKFLKHYFSEDEINKAFVKYKVGVKNGTMRWPQIDIDGNVREIKVQQHDQSNGHRVGSTYTIHSELRSIGILPKKSTSKQCLFGEHLLKNAETHNTICICESEKTSFIFSMVEPNCIWLATGGCSNFGLLWSIHDVLKSFSAIVIYPDSGYLGIWKKKASCMDLPNMVFSDICEGHPSNSDIADLFFYDWRIPIKIEPEETENISFLNEKNINKKIELAERAIQSSNQAERLKAKIFLGTYQKAIKDIESWSCNINSRDC